MQPLGRNQTVGNRNKNPSGFTGCREARLDSPKRLLLVLLLEALGPGAVALKDAVCKRVLQKRWHKIFPREGPFDASCSVALTMGICPGLGVRWAAPTRVPRLLSRLLRPIPGCIGGRPGAGGGPGAACGVSAPAPHHQHHAEQVGPTFPSKPEHFLGGFCTTNTFQEPSHIPPQCAIPLGTEGREPYGDARSRRGDAGSFPRVGRSRPKRWGPAGPHASLPPPAFPPLQI